MQHNVIRSERRSYYEREKWMKFLSINKLSIAVLENCRKDNFIRHKKATPRHNEQTGKLNTDEWSEGKNPRKLHKNIFGFRKKVASNLNEIFYYEWAKRTKFLLTVMYGSPRRHSDISKTFKNKSEKIEIKFYDHFRTNWIA